MPLLPFPKEQQPECECTVYRLCTLVLFTKACHRYKLILIRAYALLMGNSLFVFSFYFVPPFFLFFSFGLIFVRFKEMTVCMVVICCIVFLKVYHIAIPFSFLEQRHIYETLNACRINMSLYIYIFFFARML